MSTPPLASVPPLSVMMPFAVAFTAPTFRHVLVLVSGTILASGRRTVAAALRAVGLGDERRFTTYHRVLNRGIWSAPVLSRLLLDLLVRTFLASDAPLELVVDETLERRRRRKLAWKGRFHDAARSQSGHVVTSDGIRWVCVMLLAPVPWCRRRWALPCLAIPTFTPGTSAKLGKRHRTAPERTEGLVRLIPPLAAPPSRPGGRGQQLRGPATRPRLRDGARSAGLPSGAQRSVVRSATGAAGEHAGGQAEEGTTPTQAVRPSGPHHRRGRPHHLAAADGRLVRPAAARARRGHRHRALAHRRLRPAAHPLGPGARPPGPALALRTLLHRAGSRRHGDPRRLPPAVERRSHLRGGPRAPRPGDPAPVDHPRRRPHHAVPPRPLQRGRPDGPGRAPRPPPDAPGRVVPQAGGHLQRCARCRPSRTLGRLRQPEFASPARRPAAGQSSRPTHQPPGRGCLLRCLKGPKSSYCFTAPNVRPLTM